MRINFLIIKFGKQAQAGYYCTNKKIKHNKATDFNEGFRPAKLTKLPPPFGIGRGLTLEGGRALDKEQ